MRSPQTVAGAIVAVVSRDVGGGSNVRSTVMTFTPICCGSVQPATSYGRSAGPLADSATRRIALPLEQRLHVGAIRLRQKDDVGARRIRLAVGAERLERALDLDRALRAADSSSFAVV